MKALVALAGIDPTTYWLAMPGDRVETVDGPGVVLAVSDGPYAGTEDYLIELDGGRGGGHYFAGQIIDVLMRKEGRRYSQTPMACDECGCPAKHSLSGGRDGHTMLCDDCLCARSEAKQAKTARSDAGTVWRGIGFRFDDEEERDAYLKACRNGKVDAFAQMAMKRVLAGASSDWDIRSSMGKGAGLSWTFSRAVAERFASPMNGPWVSDFDGGAGLLMEAEYESEYVARDPESAGTAYNHGSHEEAELLLRPGAPITIKRVYVLMPANPRSFAAKAASGSGANNDGGQFVEIPMQPIKASAARADLPLADPGTVITAADDYEELAKILWDRPDHVEAVAGRLSMTAAKHAAWRGFTFSVPVEDARRVVAALNAGNEQEAARLIVQLASSDGIGEWWAPERIDVEGLYGNGGNLIKENGVWSLDNPGTRTAGFGVLVEGEPQGEGRYLTQWAHGTPVRITGVNLQYTEWDRARSSKPIFGKLHIPVRLSTTAASPHVDLGEKPDPSKNPIKRSLDDSRQPWWWRKIVGPMFDRFNDSLPEDQQVKTVHDLNRIPAKQWCRFRRDGHCYFPKELDERGTAEAGYNVWLPEDRGVCPYHTKATQREKCPVSEPGPDSGERVTYPDATIPWSRGGQRLSSLRTTAGWSEIVQKAKRIRTEGGVRIISVAGDSVTAEVRGDSGIYVPTITFVPGNRQIALSSCSCPWETYRWARSGDWKSLEGRPCVHITALLYEIQARRMFGGEVQEDTVAPEWRTSEPILASVTEPVAQDVLERHVAAVRVAMANAADDLVEDGLANIVAMAEVDLHTARVGGGLDLSLLHRTAEQLAVPSFYAQVDGRLTVVDVIDDDGTAWVDGRWVPTSKIYYPTYDRYIGLNYREGALRITAAEQRTGVMVCLQPSEEVRQALLDAVDGFEKESLDELHVTLAYLGKASAEIGEEQLIDAVRSFCAGITPLTGTIGGWGVFDNGAEKVLWASPDVPGLNEFRADLVRSLADAGFPVAQNHGYTPHITVAYSEAPITSIPNSGAVAGLELGFSSVAVVYAGRWTFIDLSDGNTAEMDQMVATASADEEWREVEPGKWLSMHPQGWRAAYDRAAMVGMADEYAAKFGDAPFGWQRFINVWIPGVSQGGKTLQGTARSLDEAKAKAEKNPAGMDEAIGKYDVRMDDLLGSKTAGIQSVMYHLADKADFKLDPKKRPANNSTLGGDWPVPGIFLAPDVEKWVNGYGYWRPWVVEFSVGNIAGQPDVMDGGYGGEVFVPATQFDKLRITRVLPLDAYCREEFGEYGWVEADEGLTFDTREPIDDSKWGRMRGYRYPGDARNESSAWQDEYRKRVVKFRRGRRNAYGSRVVAAWAEINGPEMNALSPEIITTCDKGDFTHAGLVIKAADTGRVLMTQRAQCHTDDPETNGAWEFPGGSIEAGEHPVQAAMREFGEETGLMLPEGYIVTGCAQSLSNNNYLSVFVTVPNESFTAAASLDPIETVGLGWFDPDHVEETPLTRPEVDDTDWDAVREATLAVEAIDVPEGMEYLGGGDDETERAENGGVIFAPIDDSREAMQHFFTEDEMRSIGQAVVAADPQGRSADEILRDEAILHDEPEPALPVALGAEDDESDIFGSELPADFVPFRLDGTDPRLAHLAADGSGDNSDIAAAAAAVMGKTALRDFSAEERKTIIQEGVDEGVRARNLDQLDVSGTHYEYAAVGADDEDDNWLG